MKRFFQAATMLAFLIAAFVGIARAQESVDLTSADDGIAMADGSRLYFVELTNAPTVDGGDLGTILAEQATFRAAATQAGIRYTEQKAHHVLWNGLAIAVNPADLGKLRRVSGVSALYPVIRFTIPDEPAVNELELATALQMTGADVAQNTLGLTGAGVKVGIIDSGQDYDHPDLGGDGVQRTDSHVFPTARAVTGYDFVGDAYVPGSTPAIPDAYPDDCNGHGTHVSGIVGGNGSFKGVAPGVTFGVYRVIGCGNTTSAAIMIDALEMAYADGMQVINMSIGSAFQWPSYPTAAASTRLVNHGVVVVASAGNSTSPTDGSAGLYASAAPAVGSKVISVASYDNNFINLNAFTISPDDHGIGYLQATGSPLAPLSGTFPLARTGTPTSTADACAALPAGSLTGKIALIRRGTCGFYNKALNAQNAGAVAVILYNNAAGLLSPSVTGTPPITIPVVGITAADGVLIDSRLAAGPVDLTWTAGSISIPNATGGFISSFSQWGLSPDLSVKPDIGAPGGLIRSSVPIEQGSYAIFSGTSMSSPHVAGAVALLLEARPGTPSNAVRDILQDSADPHNLSPTVPLLDAVHRQGAGMLDIPGAVLANTEFEPGKLSLGETSGGSVTASVAIKNKSDHAISYNLSSDAAIATGPNTYPTLSLFNAPSTVAFSANPVVVPAGGSASVDVTVTPSAGLANQSIFGGYVVVTPDDGEAVFRVPFSGFKGDYQSIVALVPTANGFPWLAKRVGTNLVKQVAGVSFSMSGTDFPNVAYHLHHPVAKLRFEIFDAVSGKAWHRFVDNRDVPRNTNSASFFGSVWDGTTDNGNNSSVVPNGNYVIKMSVLKALGDPNNPADWETWTSPAFFVARPDVALQSFRVSQNSVQAGDQVTLSAEVKNNGAAAQSGVHVRILDNDVVLGESDLDLGAGETQTFSTPWTVGPEAQHHLKAVVSPLEVEESFANNEIDLDVNLGEQIVGVGGETHVLAFAPAKPNPSRGSVAFRFSLPTAGPVALEVFDLAGRRLKTWRWTSLEPGDHTIQWDGRTEMGRAAPAGALLLRLNAMGKTLTQKAVRIH